MELSQELPPATRQLADCVYELTTDYSAGMRVPIRLVADERTLAEWIVTGFDRVVALTMLPGVTECAVALPNLNQAEAFPTGAVVGTKYREGVLVPAGVGPESNCGVRLLSTPVWEGDLSERLPALLDELERAVPAGADVRGLFPLTDHELSEVLAEGCRHLVREKGLGLEEDLERVEAGGHFYDANGAHLSEQARAAGRAQLGTLGDTRSHFVEIAAVEEVYDREAARLLELSETHVTVLVHAGARDLGRRAYTDSERLARLTMEPALPERFGFSFAPLDSPEGHACYHALRSAANYAWANRHVLTHQIRMAFTRVFGGAGEKLVRVACDSAANTLGLERREDEIVCMHRRSATRAEGAGSERLPSVYRSLGQPLIVPGSLGESSYVLRATPFAQSLTLASAPHGAGRVESRKAVRNRFPPDGLRERLERRGVLVRAPRPADLEGATPAAYRDAEEVVITLERAGLAQRVARLVPRGVLKG